MNKKLRAALTLVMMLASAPAWAEWTRVGAADDFVTYLDMDTLRKDGAMRRIWELIDLKEKNPRDGEWSRVVYWEYDCKENRIKGLQASAYSERMGKGQAIRTTTTPGPWSFTTPGTVGEITSHIICAK